LTSSFKKETKSRFPLPIGCVLYPTLALLLIGTVGYFLLQHANYTSALEATKEWAQLNEFPTSATKPTVATQGNMFTREFTVEFNAPIADINQWLNESPGTKDVAPSINGSIRRYDIKPGGGAIRAELELDTDTGHVKIITCWS